MVSFLRLPSSWLCAVGAVLFLLMYSDSSSGVVAEAAAPSGDQIFGDSLLPGAARQAGTAVQGTVLTEGRVRWSSTEGVIISATGATSSKPGGAHHVIPVVDRPVAGTIHVQAEVDARGSGFTGIALGRGDLSGNFWANLSLLFYVSGDRYNLQVESKDAIANVDKTVLHADGPNKLDLSIDIVTRAVTAKINDKAVLSGFTLPEGVRLADITASGFRFNEPVTAGKPSVSNYRAEVNIKGRMELDPVDVGQFFVVPDKEATVRWHVREPGPATSIAYW